MGMGSKRVYLQHVVPVRTPKFIPGTEIWILYCPWTGARRSVGSAWVSKLCQFNRVDLQGLFTAYPLCRPFDFVF